MSETSSKAPVAVFVGPPSEAAREALRAAAARAGYDTLFAGDATEAQRRVGANVDVRPRCVFVESESPGAATFVAWLRGESVLFAVPVVATVGRVADDVYNAAHALGADDVVSSSDLGGVTRRLANLGGFDPDLRPKLTEGPAIVAHSDMARRRVLGRILRQAGFDPSFAESVDDLSRALRGEPPALVVASEHLAPGGVLDVVRGLRAEGRSTPVVILAERSPSDDLRREIRDVSEAAVGSDLAPPDHLLFFANELIRPRSKDLRASERILFGALAGFRPAGSMEPVFGLTYNLSREGVYVRTLDPPRPGVELWFEMRPPHRRDAVHLRATVAWTRGLDRPGGAVPPGFGLRIAGERSPADDLRAYHEAYEALRETRIAFHD